MECKDFGEIKEIAESNRINRNIVECKVETEIHSLELKLVLIETLWNVKTMKPVPLIGRLMKY